MSSKAPRIDRKQAMPIRQHMHDRLTVQPLTQRDAAAIATWHYSPPYAAYTAVPADKFRFFDPANQYYAVVNDQNTLLAYCCLGDDAQVEGGTYTEETALDIGIALHPRRIGSGLGLPVLRAALAFAHQHAAPPCFRATIAAWNTVSLRLADYLGFRRVRQFTCPAPRGNQQTTFYVLLCPNDAAA